MTTQKTVTSASFRWANPLWWAERQLEATRFAVRMTAAMFDASLSSAYSPLPRVRLEASTYSAPAPQAAAAVTAVMTVAPLVRQLEAAEPHRQLQPAVPQAALQPAISETDLERLTTQSDLDLVRAGADLEAVILDAEPATAGPGPDVATAEPPAVAEPAPAPQAAAWDRALRVVFMETTPHSTGSVTKSRTWRTNKRGRAAVKGARRDEGAPRH